MMEAGYKSLHVFQQVVQTCSDFPADTYGKVVLCGNSGAGKSTLTQVGCMMYGLKTTYLGIRNFSSASYTRCLQMKAFI